MPVRRHYPDCQLVEAWKALREAVLPRAGAEPLGDPTPAALYDLVDVTRQAPPRRPASDPAACARAARAGAARRRGGSARRRRGQVLSDLFARLYVHLIGFARAHEVRFARPWRLLLALFPRITWDAACPISTEGWTRRVHFVREGGEGGGGRARRTRWPRPRVPASINLWQCVVSQRMLPLPGAHSLARRRGAGTPDGDDQNDAGRIQPYLVHAGARPGPRQMQTACMRRMWRRRAALLAARSAMRAVPVSESAGRWQDMTPPPSLLLSLPVSLQYIHSPPPPSPCGRT